MRKETSDQLEQVGVPVVYLEWDDVDDVKTAVALVGEVFGVPDLAEEYLLYFDDKQIQAAELTAGLTDGTREYTMEHLLEWDPEVMLVSTRENIEEMKADDRYAGITAVKDDEMYIIPAVAHIWGNRTVEQPLTVLWALHKLYPERLSQDALEKEIFDFYSHFFKYDLSDEQLEEIINRQ